MPWPLIAKVLFFPPVARRGGGGGGGGCFINFCLRVLLSHTLVTAGAVGINAVCALFA